MNRLLDYYFWFSPPPTILTPADNYFGYIFLGFTALAIVMRVLIALAKNSITKQLYRKIWNLSLFTGISGLTWFWVRYENTPLFGQRYWAGLTFLIALVWIFFIVKYSVLKYRQQKVEYEKEMLRNKYIPRAK